LRTHRQDSEKEYRQLRRSECTRKEKRFIVKPVVVSSGGIIFFMFSEN
jgi:hypothetical protein